MVRANRTCAECTRVTLARVADPVVDRTKRPRAAGVGSVGRPRKDEPVSLTPTTASAPIAAVGLTKRYGEVTAVDDLSFAVRRGVVTGFLGPNGAGKTTTLRMVLGLARPSAGSATILGRPYAELRDPARSVGANLEISGMHPGRSGRNHLRALAAMAALPASRVEEVLDVVEMRAAADRRAGGYSTGMRQRLGLAATLLGDPEVLV